MRVAHPPIFRNDKVYIIKRGNDWYIKPPAIGLWVVYKITIGKYFYYGRTDDFSRRMMQHRAAFERIKNGSNIATGYKKFKKEYLINVCPVFEIVEFCENKKAAILHESVYINRSSRRLCLNSRRKPKRRYSPRLPKYD